MNGPTCGGALLAMLAWSSIARSQAPPNPEVSGVASAVGKAATMDPSLSSPVLPPVLDLKLEATRTDKTAALLVGRGIGTNRSFHLKVSAPIDTSDDDTELANLRGLSDTATAEVGIKQIFGWDWKPRFGMKDFGPKLDEACTKATGKPDCGLASLPLDRADEFIEWKGMPRLFGLTVEGGRKSFSWSEPVTLAKKDSQHTAYSTALAFGVFPLVSMRAKTPLRGLYYVGLNARYETSYKGQTKTQLCIPFGSGGALKCSDVVIGAPRKSIKAIAELEVRKYFGSNFLAIPRVSHDFRKTVTGVELPLYFLKDLKGGLNGGISLGWRSDERSITASVFVGHFADIWK